MVGKWCPFCCCFLRCNFQNGHDIEFIERSRVDSLYDGFCFFAIRGKRPTPETPWGPNRRSLFRSVLRSIADGTFVFLVFRVYLCKGEYAGVQQTSRAKPKKSIEDDRMNGGGRSVGRRNFGLFLLFFVLRSVCRTNF